MLVKMADKSALGQKRTSPAERLLSAKRLADAVADRQNALRFGEIAA